MERFITTVLHKTVLHFLIDINMICFLRESSIKIVVCLLIGSFHISIYRPIAYGDLTRDIPNSAFNGSIKFLP